jgi:hypothetical protein
MLTLVSVDMVFRCVILNMFQGKTSVFMIYSTTLSILVYLVAMLQMLLFLLVNNELERMRKEAHVSKFKEGLSRHLFERIEEKHGKSWIGCLVSWPRFEI